MKNEDLTHKIIGCAYQVFNTFGFGFLESVYKKALTIELKKNELKTDEEKPLKIYYGDEDEAQLVNYLNAARKEIGLLINFGPKGVEVKRKYRSPINDSKA